MPPKAKIPAVFFLSLFALVACGDSRPMVVAPAQQQVNLGPIVAQVGERGIHASEVDPLAQMALEVRKFAEVDSPTDPSFQEKVSLATELLLLASGVDSKGREEKGVLDEKKRLLVRLLLDRTIGALASEPVTEEEIRQEQEAQLRQVLQTGNSDLIRPTEVDASAIVVGHFEEAGSLAKKIRDACGDRVPDLDRFHQIGRQLMKGHPTVRVEEFGFVPIRSEMARIDPSIHRAIVALDGHGAVSQPKEADQGIYILRRGFTRMGQGEDLEEMRPIYVQRIRQERQRQAFLQLVDRIKKGLPISTWPERFVSQKPNRTAS
jgi:hypothetical protein